MRKGIIFPLLLLLVSVALIIGAFFILNNKPKATVLNPTQAAPQLQEIDTTKWKTYTYKNISFKYPDNWVVIFDSKIAGQPNGFALHAQDENATGYQPDGFYLSTYNGRDNDTYVLNPARKFNKRSQSDSYIQFEVNANRFYSGCAFYAKQETIDICNKILSTIRFNDQADTSDWKTYMNNSYSYSFIYPSEIVVEEGANSNEVVINNHIRVFVEPNSDEPSGPCGDCPNYDGPTTNVIVDGKTTEKFSGEIGAIGGNVPQEFQEVQIVRGKFTIF